MRYSKLCPRRMILAAVTFLLLTVALPLVSIGVNAGNHESTGTQLYAEVDGKKVYVLDIRDCGFYLFLPAEADGTCIRLYSENDSQVLFMDGELFSEEIDLRNSFDIGSNVFETDLRIITDPDNAELSETMHLHIMKGKSIGSFFYNSDDIENNGIGWVETSRNNHGTGTALVTDPDGNVLYRGKIDDIHMRGNSSLQDPKKSYQVKLSKKAALAGKEKGKKWVLLAMYKDPLRIDDMIMKEVANVSDDKYAADETLVNLYYDGCYRGVYNLSEKNEVKSNRIDITDMEEYYEDQDSEYGETAHLAKSQNKYNNTIQYQEGLEGPEELGGYLIEMNANHLDSSNGFFFTVNDTKRYVSVDSPEFGSKEAIKYISEYFQNFMDAIYGSEDGKTGWNPDTGLFYYDYCDLDSLVNTYLLQTIASNSDAFWKSQYFYKDVNQKMFAGPVWDMDLTFGTAWEYQSIPEEDRPSRQVMSGGLIKIPSFRTKLKGRYFSHYQSIMASLLGEDDKVPSFADVYETAKPNLLMDAVLWPVKYKCGDGTQRWSEDESLDTIADYRINWIQKHKQFLDSYFGNMNEPEDTSHVYGDPAYENDESHKRICIECGDVLLSEHVWDDGIILKEASCIEEGAAKYTCSVCGGAKEAVIPVSSHALVCVEEKQPTYESEGNIEYYICSVCEKIFSDKEASVEIDEKDTIIDKKTRPVISGITRVAGASRYQTSFAISDVILTNSGSEKHDCVILASGDSFADALSGSCLSAGKSAPIIITTPAAAAEVNDYIQSILKENGTIYVLGGASAVPESSLDGLTGKGYTIKRLWGSDRYGTNLAILDEASISTDKILIATGTNYADSLSASATGLPVLLVKGTDQLIDDQRQFLEANQNKEFIILGGNEAVSSDFENELSTYGRTERIYGASRFETSAEIAKRFFPDAAAAVLTYGSNFPDGLCGGPLAYQSGAPLILTRDDMTDITASYMKERNITDGYALGGKDVLFDETIQELFGAGNNTVISEINR